MRGAAADDAASAVGEGAPGVQFVEVGRAPIPGLPPPPDRSPLAGDAARSPLGGLPPLASKPAERPSLGGLPPLASKPAERPSLGGLPSLGAKPERPGSGGLPSIASKPSLGGLGSKPAERPSLAGIGTSPPSGAGSAPSDRPSLSLGARRPLTGSLGLGQKTGVDAGWGSLAGGDKPEQKPTLGKPRLSVSLTPIPSSGGKPVSGLSGLGGLGGGLRPLGGLGRTSDKPEEGAPEEGQAEGDGEEKP
ncbi:MAG: hypothetical protein H6705_07990 [Myxococcales bacterium]|nr:hypothetical protein [Myxococcales bacterium]